MHLGQAITAAEKQVIERIMLCQEVVQAGIYVYGSVLPFRNGVHIGSGEGKTNPIRWTDRRGPGYAPLKEMVVRGMD